MKTVFLFGAGASYGSDASGTPPLGAGLFNELCRFDPNGWGTLPIELANQFRANFEVAMRLVPNKICLFGGDSLAGYLAARLSSVPSLVQQAAGQQPLHATPDGLARHVIEQTSIAFGNH